MSFFSVTYNYLILIVVFLLFQVTQNVYEKGLFIN